MDSAIKVQTTYLRSTSSPAGFQNLRCGTCGKIFAGLQGGRCSKHRNFDECLRHGEDPLQRCELSVVRYAFGCSHARNTVCNRERRCSYCHCLAPQGAKATRRKMRAVSASPGVKEMLCSECGKTACGSVGTSCKFYHKPRECMEHKQCQDARRMIRFSFGCPEARKDKCQRTSCHLCHCFTPQIGVKGVRKITKLESFHEHIESNAAKDALGPVYVKLPDEPDISTTLPSDHFEEETVASSFGEAFDYQQWGYNTYGFPAFQQVSQDWYFSQMLAMQQAQSASAGWYGPTSSMIPPGTWNSGFNQRPRQQMTPHQRFFNGKGGSSSSGYGKSKHSKGQSSGYKDQWSSNAPEPIRIPLPTFSEEDLLEATRAGDEVTVMHILTKGSVITAMNDTGQLQWPGLKSLNAAVSAGHSELAIRIRESLVDSDENGRTPLHYAALGDFVFASQFLAADKTLWTVKDRNGYAPLHLAAMAGCENIFSLVTELDLEEQSEYLSAQDSQGFMPIHLAADRGHLNVVKFLTDAVTMSALEKTLEGETALHLAVRGGHVNLVQFLIESLPGLIDVKSENGDTALHLASRRGNSEIFELLRKFASPELLMDVKSRGQVTSGIVKDRDRVNSGDVNLNLLLSKLQH